MTREEAIRLLDPKTTADALADIEYYAGLSGKEACIKAIEDACVLAVEALKKQIPKKPIHICVDGIRYIDSYRCPNCQGAFTGTGIARYCHHCGQDIDWEADKQ